MYSNSNSELSGSSPEYSYEFFNDDNTFIDLPNTYTFEDVQRTAREDEINFTSTKKQAEKFDSGNHRDTWKHEMSQSFDGEELSAEEIDKLLEDFECPQCQSSSTSKVDDLNVRFCKDCHSCFGADDSMDLDDLQRLLSEGKVIIRPTKRCPCGNDDIDKFVIDGINESTGQILVECQLCSRKMELETVIDGRQDNDSGWSSDDQSYKDPLVEEEEEENEKDTSQNFFLRTDCNFPQPTPSPTKQPSQQVHSQFICRGCDVSEDDFFEKHCDVSGKVTSFKCLNCGCTNELPVQQIVCRGCDVSEDDFFEKHYDVSGKVTSFKCLNCLFTNEFAEISPEGRSQIQPARNVVKLLDNLSVGDHVSWHKDSLIWHHAIVIAVKSRDGKLTVIHYSGSRKKRDGHYISIREDDKEVDLTREKMYVYDYGDLSYQPAEVVQRARSRLGEHKYNPISENCEHFASWCKTGVARCGQVQAFGRRMLKTGGTAVSTGLREGFISACRGVIEGLPRKQILGVGFKAGLDRLKGVATGPRVAAAIKGGVLAFDVVLNLVFEAGLFAYCAYRANRKYKSGLISKPELHREICQVGCECVGGFLGGTAGGILGQLAIPVPFLGAMIGCTLGSLIGRYLGSLAGKKITEKFLYKNEIKAIDKKNNTARK